jgi:hypothetical protein
MIDEWSFCFLSLPQTAFLKFKKQKSPGFAEGVICLCGERGITFGDPLGEFLATPNYSLTRFTRMAFLFFPLPQTAFLKFKKQKSPGFIEGVICLCGERGITFGDPLGEFPAMPNYSLTRFTRMVFLFFITSINCVLKVQKTKIPRFYRGSNLSLRREGDSNPRYPFEVHTLSRRAS